MRPSYPEILSPTPDQLRIGADWDSGTFGGDQGPLASNILSTDTRTGPAGAWAATRAWGAPYHHPLVAGNSAPSMNPNGSAIFAVGAGLARPQLAQAEIPRLLSPCQHRERMAFLPGQH